MHECGDKGYFVLYIVGGSLKVLDKFGAANITKVSMNTCTGQIWPGFLLDGHVRFMHFLSMGQGHVECSINEKHLEKKKKL